MPDYTYLARRAVACKHWRWMRGMVAVTASGAHFLRGTDTWEWDDHGALPGGPPQSEIAALLAGEILPDLTDAATLGCLLALVRETWGDPVLFVQGGMLFGSPTWTLSGHKEQQSVLRRIRLGCVCDLEAEALVFALEAE